ncbi:MAG: DNA recombination protein RmuC [Bacteroidetes bacterium]|nr:DNA recombination protein RmuC [Bacteroidota bacterium]MCW5894432.1 DNA recombination protein RmuC [Bacteroidota bacterium]
MVETLLIVSTVLLILVLVLVLVVLLRKPKDEVFVELEKELALLQENAERLERSLREEFSRSRNETSGNLSQQRQELTTTLSSVSEGVRSELDKIRETVEGRLELMRATVDDKLHKTLEQRLGESFRHVSERLELVHKGLGEMQTLASGVGDLRKVLTNVKTRGTWGEIQLGNLLEQLLTPDQYAKNVATKPGSNDRVEFAVKLPGREKEDEPVWLPLDAKFPQEDYHRLVDAAEQANAALVDESGKLLEARIKKEANTIKEKYLAPPHTTDFAILFLPTEGLYAEVTRRAGLLETLQRESRVTVMGPTTVAAFLNSLQMGFRTLAIERRSSEVWSLLGTVKTEFSRFGEILEKTQKKLHEVSNTIDAASRQSRAIERKLKDVQQLPPTDSAALLPEIGQPDEPES